MPEKLDPNNKKRVYKWAKDLREDGVDRRRPQEAVWWQNIATYTGDLWVEYSMNTRELLETVPQAPHKVRLPVNLAQPAVRTEYAKLLKNKPIVDVLANSKNREDINAAEVGDKMLNNWAEKQYNMPRVRREMIQWALVCGAGG